MYYFIITKGDPMNRISYLFYIICLLSPAYTYNTFIETTDCCTKSCRLFDVRIQAGAEPLIWRDRGGIFGENITINGAPADLLFSFQANETTMIQGQCIPKFSTFFKTPWVIGGQIGYTHRDCVRFFIEGNYAQAKAKSPCKTRLPVFASTGAPAGTTLNFTLNNYRFVDGYVGANYYIGHLCDVGIYICAKLGFIHHIKSTFSLTETIPLDPSEPPFILNLVPPCPKTSFIKSNTSFAGGATLGIDYYLCDNLIIALAGEVIANRGPKTNCNIPVSIPGIPTISISFGPIKTEIRFPIIAFLRYIF